MTMRKHRVQSGEWNRAERSIQSQSQCIISLPLGEETVQNIGSDGEDGVVAIGMEIRFKKTRSHGGQRDSSFERVKGLRPTLGVGRFVTPSKGLRRCHGACLSGQK